MSENPNEPLDLSLEAPLAGLIAKPRHLLSDAELRERVARIHELRVSSQSFQAMVRGADNASNRGEKEDSTAFGEFDLE